MGRKSNEIDKDNQSKSSSEAEFSDSELEPLNKHPTKRKKADDKPPPPKKVSSSMSCGNEGVIDLCSNSDDDEGDDVNDRRDNEDKLDNDNDDEDNDDSDKGGKDSVDSVKMMMLLPKDVSLCYVFILCNINNDVPNYSSL